MPSRWTSLLKRRSRPSPSSPSFRVTCSTRARPFRLGPPAGRGVPRATLASARQRRQSAGCAVNAHQPSGFPQVFGRRSSGAHRADIGRLRPSLRFAGDRHASPSKRRAGAVGAPDRRCSHRSSCPAPQDPRWLPAHSTLTGPECRDGLATTRAQGCYLGCSRQPRVGTDDLDGRVPRPRSGPLAPRSFRAELALLAEAGNNVPRWASTGMPDIGRIRAISGEIRMIRFVFAENGACPCRAIGGRRLQCSVAAWGAVLCGRTTPGRCTSGGQTVSGSRRGRVGHDYASKPR